jgi:hypothetical protein
LQVWKNDVVEQIELSDERKAVKCDNRTEQMPNDKKKYSTCKEVFPETIALEIFLVAA